MRMIIKWVLAGLAKLVKYPLKDCHIIGSLIFPILNTNTSPGIKIIKMPLNSLLWLAISSIITIIKAISWGSVNSVNTDPIKVWIKIVFLKIIKMVFNNKKLQLPLLSICKILSENLYMPLSKKAPKERTYQRKGLSFDLN